MRICHRPFLGCRGASVPWCQLPRGRSGYGWWVVPSPHARAVPVTHPLVVGQAVPQPQPPIGAAFASCWFPQVPGASDRHLLLVPSTGGSHVLGKRVPGSSWGFPRESWDLGIFCPPLLPSFLQQRLSLTCYSRGHKPFLKKATSHTMLFPNGCW